MTGKKESKDEFRLRVTDEYVGSAKTGERRNRSA